MKHLRKFNEGKKTSDYTIFKIRYYADGVNVRKGIFKGDDKQAWDRAKLLTSLFGDMVEFVTKKPISFWIDKFGFGYTDCMKEELHEHFGIIIPNSEEYDYWFIPNELTDVINWIKENCKLPYTIAKRTEFSNDWISRKKPTDFNRRMAKPIKLNK